MDADIEDRIRDWPSRRVDDGYGGLRHLADADFSGAVSLDATWVFMVGGRVVGLRDGSIEDLEVAAGTAYQAPADALPLLFTMQTASDTEVRGQYYTEETPLSQVDARLEDAGFTGYVELSDNVLSGDYYLVYHGGRSRSVAMVGTREEVLQGQEAYDLAADEVGIYDVIQAPVTVTEIPDPVTDTPSVAAGGSNAGPTDGPEEPDHSGEGEGGAPASRAADAAGSGPVDEETEAPEDAVETVAQGDPQDGHPPKQPGSSDTADEPGDEPEPEPRSDTASDDGSEASASSPGLSVGSTPSDGDTGEPESTGNSSAQPPTEGDSESTRDAAPDATEKRLEARIKSLETEFETAEERADSLAAERSELAQEVEALTDELSRVEAERDDLTERVTQLEAELADVGEPATEDRTDRPFQEAMRETNLFVRYDTRSEPTLKDLQEGIDRERLRNNMEIEVHTTFDRQTVSIDGAPFEAALRSSPEWAFVNWLVRDLPFEIRDTGQTDGLKALMNAIPEIDRIDLQGAVESDGAQKNETAVGFDVILRTKTGGPLIVADIHHGREPVGGESVEDLIDRTTQVLGLQEGLSAAFTISESFFSPDALEAASAATSSGFLSRDSRLSYVKTERSHGFHLCLVEARDDAFHVTVPEL